jgi:hypothetical protein
MNLSSSNYESLTTRPIIPKAPPLNPTLVELYIKVLKMFLYYLFLPITYCFTLAAKSLLYVSVFPMTTYHSDLGRWIIKTFAASKIDLIRVGETKKALEFIGGEQVEVETVDGEKIEVIRVTQQNFRNKIESLGGGFVDYQNDFLIHKNKEKT